MVIQRLASAVRLVVPILAFLCSSASAQTQVRGDLWVTNGKVNAIETLGNSVYIGGTFTQVGPSTGTAAAIDALTGNAKAPFPRIDGSVACVVSDGAGGWFVGGSFAHVLGVPRKGLARIDANGNVTAWDPAPTGWVTCLLRAGGVLYVGGNFGVGGRNFAAAFDIATGALTSWDPGCDSAVNSMVEGGGRIYLQGDFFNVGGQPRFNGIAAVDPTSGACLPWTTAVEGRVLMVLSGTLYVGGRSGDLLQVSETTGAVQSTLPVAGVVNAAVRDPATGTMYFGGSFLSVNGSSRLRLAALDAGGSLTSWSPAANGDVEALAMDAGTIFAAGWFTTLGGQPRPYLGSIAAATGAVTSWNPRPNAEMLTIASYGGVAYAGGHCSSMNTVDRRNAAALDASIGSALPWNPNPDGEVVCFAAGSGTVYMGGSFQAVGGVTHIHFAAVDATSGTPTPWTANMNLNDSNRPDVMKLYGNTLYAGGGFQIVAGVTRKFLAAFDATTGALLPWNPNPDGPVRCMDLVTSSPPTLYVGGQFVLIAGGLRSHTAAFNPSDGTLTPWTPDPNHWVLALRAKENTNGDRTIYMGGLFTTVFGGPRNYLAAVDGLNGFNRLWNPNANSFVHSLAVAGNVVYAGGYFTTVGGQSRNHLAAIDAITGVPTSSAPHVEEVPFVDVLSLVQFRKTLFVGGNFGVVQGVSSRCLAGLVDGTVTEVAEAAPPPMAAVLRAAPNPFHTHTDARFHLPRAELASVAIYDVAGRRVRRLHRGHLAAGPHTFPWDGLSDHGRTAPTGIYFLRVITPSLELATKLHRIR